MLTFLQFDTSSVHRALSSPTLVQDWYEPHYLSVCSGMWKNHVRGLGKNESTVVCVPQAAGYTFSLGEILAEAASRSLSDPRTLNTTTPFVLVVLGVVSTGVSVASFMIGIVLLFSKKIAETKLLIPLRVAFFSTIAASIFLTISSAKITAWAAQTAGTIDVGIGGGETATVSVHAWLETPFYVAAWTATACMWLALVVAVTLSFRYSHAVQREIVEASSSSHKAVMAAHHDLRRQ
jgi:hypothetical protein